jgi:hypothetical protein
MIKKSFTLIELDYSDPEAPMIGTLINIKNTDRGEVEFKEKFHTAVCEHFDVEDFNHDEIPDLFDGSPYHDVTIEVDGVNYEIRIMETWYY